MTMLIGFGTDRFEASRETEMQLIEKWKGWHPGSTDAEAEAALHAMSPGERFRIVLGRHEMDRGQPGNACVVDYDPLPASPGPVESNLPAPDGALTGDRGWYRR